MFKRRHGSGFVQLAETERLVDQLRLQVHRQRRVAARAEREGRGAAAQRSQLTAVARELPERTQRAQLERHASAACLRLRLGLAAASVPVPARLHHLSAAPRHVRGDRAVILRVARDLFAYTYASSMSTVCRCAI